MNYLRETQGALRLRNLGSEPLSIKVVTDRDNKLICLAEGRDFTKNGEAKLRLAVAPAVHKADQPVSSRDNGFGDATCMATGTEHQNSAYFILRGMAL